MGKPEIKVIKEDIQSTKNSISTINGQLAEKASNLSVNTLNNIVGNKADKVYVESLLKNLSGTPKIVVQTTTQLPVIGGSEKIALVLANGHIYYDNGTIWVDAGVYQSSNVTAEMVGLNSDIYSATDIKNALEESKEKFSDRVLKYVNSLHSMKSFASSSNLDIPNDTVNNSLVEFKVKNNGLITNEINFNGFRSKSKNLFNKTTVIKGKYANHTTGQILNEPSQVLSAPIEITGGTDYSFASEQGIRYGRMIYYDTNDNFITGIVGGISDVYITLKSPSNATKLRVCASESAGKIETWQVEKGIGFTGYQEYTDDYFILETPVKLIGYNNISDTLNHEGLLYKLFEKSILTQNLTWYFHQETTSNYHFYVSVSDATPNALTNTTNSGIGKSSNGDFPITATYSDAKGIAILSNGNLFVTVPKTAIDSFTGVTQLDRFKKYLETYPITLYYQLASPTKKLIKMKYPLVYTGGRLDFLSDVTPSVDLKLSVKNISINSTDKNFVQLESAGTTHFGGYAYTSFGGGVMVDGKEIFILRNAKQHVTTTGDYGRTVAYIRDKKGNWDKKLLDLGLLNKEFRDINLSLPYDGTRDIILTGALYDGTTYENWLFRLDKDLNLKSSEQIITSNQYFSWGNYLFTPSGVGIKTAYDVNITATSRGVRLLRKTGTTYDDSIVLFEGSSQLPTEATIGYWGNKLVAICRQNAGYSLYRETTDLEGLTGWSQPRVLDFKAHAPCLQPYTPKNEPLILTFSTVTPTIIVSTDHRDVSISSTFNGINWHKEVVISKNNHYGGYNSFVKVGNGKYSMVYYDDYNKQEANYKVGTDLYYEQVDVDRFLNDLEWFRYNYNNTQ